MSFPRNVNALIRQICETFAAVTREHYGPLPVKLAAGEWDVTEPTARKMIDGELDRTQTSTSLTALFALPVKKRRQILRPLIDEMPELDEFEELRAIRRSLEVIEARRANAEVPGAVGAVPVATLGGSGSLRHMAGGQDREEARLASNLAVVSARAPLDTARAHEALGRQLAAWEARGGRIEVEAAIACAKADPLKQTGVAIRRPGSTWVLPHVAERHPFRGLPVNQNQMAEEFDRTAADGRPWLLDTGAVYLKGGSVATTANWVLRTIDKARDGTLILTAGFAPKVAA